MSGDSPLELIGSTIANRYHIEKLIGRGGMGVVYCVRDSRSGLDVALKRCWSRDARQLQRHESLLEREYYTLAQLAHPRIIAVYDYGIDHDHPYYTMELLGGSSLEGSERLPWRQTCSLLCDVASSLAILHSRGLLHRDVSLRNVHYTTDGHAKLLDFGAMISMGVAKDVVGTPPFMAPELLQLQALDGRADLFALGALGYRLLTGRHAFAAKRLGDLRDVWRSRPAPPAQLIAELPPELSTLVLQMLALDRGGRPQTAAEVIERLRAIADVQLDEDVEVSRAYLITPTLVGRDPAQLQLRKRTLGLVRGEGGLVLVRGDSGSGRSRVLDACALEGKLLGAAVVRADSRDGGNGDWGVARAIASQLVEQFPQRAFDAARLLRNVLAHVVDELRSDDVQTTNTQAPERSVLIRGLRDWVLSLAKTQRLLIVVDDADRIDEPSVALLSALAHKAGGSALLLALAVEHDREQLPSAAVRLLFDLADTIELEPLAPSETEALIRSLFGDAPNLPLWAARIHALSQGSPRAIMELAQHLVDAGVAHYEAGGWALPERLEPTALPSTFAASLSARFTTLSPDARELADLLALTEADGLATGAYVGLTEHRQSSRVFKAFDELVKARVLRADAEGYAFTQRGLCTVLQNTMAAQRCESIHLRVARLLASSATKPLRRAHHLLAAGVDAEAIELLCGLDLAALSPPVELLATAIGRGEQLDLGVSALHQLRMALLIQAPLSLDHERFTRVVPAVLAQLERESGLLDYRELSHLPQDERLQQALARAQARYLATPAHARVHTVLPAIRELAQLSGSMAAMATSTFNHDLLASLPALEPLFPLSPTLRIVSEIVRGARQWLEGQLRSAKATYVGILERIAEPDRAGLDASQHERVRLGLEYTLGLLDATWGNERAQTRARLLEPHRELRVNAWRLRALLHLARGNSAASRKCMRRAQLLQAQDGLSERYVGSTAGMELLLHARLGDLAVVKSRLDTVERLAARHPGWRAVALFGRAAYCDLRGDLQTALEAVTSALELAPPQRLPFFGLLTAWHVHILTELGRAQEAAARTRDYLAACNEHGLIAGDLHRYGALALSRVGDVEAGLALLETYATSMLEAGGSGFLLGLLYETAAQLALEIGDGERFERFVGRCAVEYEKAENPDLAARISQLIERAREHELAASAATLALQGAFEPHRTESQFETVHSRMAECVDAFDRGRCALTLLMQHTLSPLGVLYAMRGGSPRMLAALPDTPDDHGLQPWLERYVAHWRELYAADQESTTQGTAAAVATKTGGSGPSVQRHTDRDGRHLLALALECRLDADVCLAGVLVLQVRPREVVTLPTDLVDGIARELVERGDAEAHASSSA